MPSSVVTTTVTHWGMIVSVNTLKSVGDRWSPWFMPWYPLNRSTKYLPDLATMVSRYQYVQRTQINLGTTPFAERIARHMSQSRASCAFWGVKKISKRTDSLMDLRCWIRLALREEFPVPRPAQNPFSTS